MDRLGQGAVYLLFRFLLLVLRIVFALPRVKGIMVWLFQKAIRYRGNVVRSNLKLAFPEKTEAEIHQISTLFYGHFADLILQHVEGWGFEEGEWKGAVCFAPGNALEDYSEKGQSSIVVMGHTGNWEWAGLRASWVQGVKMATVYKPQRNRFINRYLLEERSKFGMEQVPMKGVMRFIQTSEKPFCLTFLADQSGPRDSEFYPTFFGVETSFFGGWAKIAIRKGLPVLYAGVKKTGVTTYKVHFVPLWDGKGKIEASKLVQFFAQKLEDDIRQQPENWLWSHRRWKWRKKVEGIKPR